MVLGLRTKNRKGTSVQVDYLIHVQEIKPWPPSQSLRSLRSVLLQWENGDRSSGSTSPVVPSIGSGVGDGKIEFNESFRLPVTLSRDAPIKGGDAETFQKNCLEFNLYEPRRDKTVRGQLLGTVIIDLAEYGIIKETVNIGSPMNCKRSFRNTAQPVLFVKIQPFDKDSSTSLPRESLSKEASLDKDGRESVSALMSEEYAEEAEIACFTDDDVSSHSSLTHSSSAFEAAGVSPPQNEENVSETAKNSTVSCKEVPGVPLEQVPTKSEEKPTTLVYKLLSASSSHSSSINKPSDLGSPETDHVSSSNFPDKSLMLIPEKSVVHGVQSSSSSIAFEGSEVVVRSSNGTRSFDQDDLAQEVHENAGNGCSQSEEEPQLVQEINTNDFAAKVSYSDTDLQVGEQAGLVTSADSHLNGKDNGKTWGQSRNGLEEAATTNDPHPSLMEDKDGDKQGENGQEELTGNEKNYSMEDKAFKKFSQVAVEKQVVSGGDTTSLNRRAFGGKGNTLVGDRLKHVKSVRSSLEVARSNGLVSDNKLTEEVKEIDFLEDADNVTKSVVTDGGKDPKVAFRETRKSLSDGKVQQLESRIERLEGELREAAAIEVALYSVMAEHGSSANKVHAPARRLSRLYLHACRKWSPARRASAARSAVSGLVLVAKACGNDIPRLTFWLSNSVVLRVVIGQAIEDSQLPISAGPRIETNGGGNGINRRSSLKWNESSPNKKEKKFGFAESFDEWEDPRTFTTALVKIEAWIFSRIIESVWWQILTPHMQSAAGKVSDQNLGSNPRKIFGRRSSLADQEQGNFSLDHWKKAFKGACERLCPVRAGGHECGCLPVLARLVMEQCVDRLDVAMFNAILRESDDEIPTDPVSDPISDAKVLPILAGKSSFGAGAQLKNAIGNWSRWLTDLFGIDDDSLEDENELDDDDRLEFETSFKSFYLLNALSDLMMLPKDMLLNRSIRKEVCPTFGAPLIKRILNNFVPDEFCPDPIPEALLVALDSEEPLEAEEESIRNFPCSAARIVYLPPSTASLADSIGEVGNQSQLRRSGSSVLRKSYTSDDELDELDSPLASIIDSSRASPTSTIPSWKPERKGGRSAVRYQLLREVWRDDN